VTTQFAIAEDGVKLAYERVGSGAAVVMVHGFGSSRSQNWKSTGWFSSLTDAGYMLTAMDCRGHGESDKPHDSGAYGHARMADDVIRVMDAAEISDGLLLGYSMGGFIGLRVVAAHPERVVKLALAGVGEHYLHGPRISDPNSRDMLAEALLTEHPEELSDPRAKLFRAFADQPGKDRYALAACMRAMSPRLDSEILSRIAQPVLVVCGEKDDIAGAAEPLAAQFRQGSAMTISGRDHMSAVGDRKMRAVVAEFFSS
jgi:pimeloyl-ACP methyl ester carboxylesterase